MAENRSSPACDACSLTRTQGARIAALFGRLRTQLSGRAACAGGTDCFAPNPPNLALDHVQLLTPPGGVEDAVRFYGEVVGLERIERPKAMGGVGAWFRAGAHELHLSEEEAFVPAARAHPAFAVSTAELDALADRLAAAGAEVQWDERLPGARRFYSHDPAGNRLEFLSRTA